jgi:hypothetical protein
VNDYSNLLFLHIVGALGMFVALGLEWTGLSQLRRARSVETAAAWMGVLKNVRRFGLASMLATIVSGMYMATKYWDREPWIMVTMVALVLIIALAQTLTAPRMRAVGMALMAGRGTFPGGLPGLARHPLLSLSIHTRVAIALGIVFLKTDKPDLAGSLLTIAIAIALGVASSLSVPRRQPAAAPLTN